MPKKYHVPKYALHKRSGQARVRINGVEHWLGPFGSDASKARYDELVAKLLADRHDKDAGLTVNQLVALFWRFCKTRYGRKGRGRWGEAINWRRVLRWLRQRHGKELAASFGPRKLQAMLNDMPSEMGWARRYCNENLQRIKRVFKWGASLEYLPITTYQALTTVEGLRRGVTDARETAPILPVDDDVVQATVPSMRPIIRDMVLFQRATGCRPGELVRIRPCDVDRSGDIWRIRLGDHKTAHHDKTRIIYVGPRAQEILAKYLLRLPEVWCFQSRPGTRYSTDSYRRAVHRAAERAKQPRWSPNQLRHTAGTEVRAAFGLESVQAVLGHSHMKVSEVYAQRHEALAIEAAKKLG